MLADVAPQIGHRFLGRPTWPEPADSAADPGWDDLLARPAPAEWPNSVSAVLDTGLAARRVTLNGKLQPNRA